VKSKELVTKVEIRAPDYRSPVHDTGHPQFSSLEHHSGRTFGTFWLREHEKMPPDKQKSLETAFRAAQEFAENPRGWLVLNGDYGTGKTHLAAAIGNYQHSLGATPVFVVVPELLDHLRATFSPSSHVSYDDLFEEVKNAQLLILDDLGTESATPWAREKLYQIFNYRYNLQLPTVITTSRKIEELDPRIRSRMLDSRLCDIYAILADPFRGVSNPKIRRSTRKTTTQR
jgi:DNA replication protein DnaC